MKLSLALLKYAEPSLSKLADLDLPVRTAYSLARALRKIGVELKDAETQRVKLVRKYSVPEGVESAAGPTEAIKVLPENMLKFNEDMRVLYSTEVHLDVQPIPFESLGTTVKLSAADLGRLDPFLQVEEPVAEEKPEPAKAD